jgi:hypothetical protein
MLQRANAPVVNCKPSVFQIAIPRIIFVGNPILFEFGGCVLRINLDDTLDGQSKLHSGNVSTVELLANGT